MTQRRARPSEGHRPWHDSSPSHIDPATSLDATSMLVLWRRTVARRAGAPILHHVDHSIGATEVDRSSDAFAAAVQELGLHAGDRAAIRLQNDPHWVTSLLGLWKAGVTVVPVNPMTRARELRTILEDSGARLLVTSPELHAECDADCLLGTRVERTILAEPFGCCEGVTAHRPVDDRLGPTSTIDELLTAFGGHVPTPVTVTGDDLGLLTYTSGTTGPPKGAMNSHANIAYNAQLTTAWFDLSERDVVLAIAPLFHITGLVVQMAASLCSGAPMILFHRFDAAEALRLIERWRATYSIGAITAYIAMMSEPSIAHRDLSSLTKVASGGAPVSAATVQRFEAVTGIYIHNAYGLTETTAPSILTPLGTRAPVDEQTGALSVGVPVPGADVTLVDPQTREPVQLGEAGEIVISGPMVVGGYWRQPEESIHAIPGGRLHTGDIGRMDDDGWVFIIDRAKDQINAAGFKIWPREVEDVLHEHPMVREAAVVGRPDEYRGETVVAFVVPAGEDPLDVGGIIRFCRARLSAYKCPTHIEVVAELPKTLSGKVLRRELRERFRPSGGS